MRLKISLYLKSDLEIVQRVCRVLDSQRYNETLERGTCGDMARHLVLLRNCTAGVTFIWDKWESSDKVSDQLSVLFKFLQCIEGWHCRMGDIGCWAPGVVDVENSISGWFQ